METMTYAQLCAIEAKAARHFRASASAWERANNCPADTDYQRKYRAQCARREQSEADKGEALLAPFGIKCDWPGLYPSFKVGGNKDGAGWYTVHDLRSALSDAVTVGLK